ncbi:unnamed protein product, partial [Ranitomeya imitator]
MPLTFYKSETVKEERWKYPNWCRNSSTMHHKLLKSAHYIELGSYQYWPVLLPRGIRLYTYEQIPIFLKDNPYITDGYRAYLPSRLCLKSLFILSNETVNIWSHLLGFLLFFTLGVYDMMSVLPSVNASREDFVICSICLFCFQRYVKQKITSDPTFFKDNKEKLDPKTCCAISPDYADTPYEGENHCLGARQSLEGKEHHLN